MESKIDPKVIWTFVVFASLGVIIFCFYIIANEILEARKECNNLDGEYDFKISFKHFCDEREFIKYNSCQMLGTKRVCNLIWTFEDSIGKINVSEFIK